MMNFVPPIGSKPQQVSPEQRKMMREHFQHEMTRQVGVEPDLLVYVILLLIAVAIAPFIFK